MENSRSETLPEMKISDYALNVWAIKHFISEHTSNEQKTNEHTKNVLISIREKHGKIPFERLSEEIKQSIVESLKNELDKIILQKKGKNQAGRRQQEIDAEKFYMTRAKLKQDYLKSYQAKIPKYQKPGQEPPTIGAVAWGESDFPDIYDTVPETDRPVLLFYEGDISLFKKNKQVLRLTVIGLLNPTQEIMDREKRIIDVLMEHDATIISGLAYGCDQIAHDQTLYHNGKTVAILPSPLYNIVPSKNQRLAQGIVESGGLLISEYYNAPKDKYEHIRRFIERDRLQAMFCDAIILIASYSEEKSKEFQIAVKEMKNFYKNGSKMQIFELRKTLDELYTLAEERSKKEPDKICEHLIRIAFKINQLRAETDESLRTPNRLSEEIIQSIDELRFDSGARHAVKKAEEYGVPRVVMYDETQDADNNMFSLNREIIQDKNRDTVYTIGREFEQDIDRIIERLQTSDSTSPLQLTLSNCEISGSAQACTSETQPESQASLQSTEDDFELTHPPHNRKSSKSNNKRKTRNKSG